MQPPTPIKSAALILSASAGLCLLTGMCRAAEPIRPDVARLYSLVKNGGFEEGGDYPSYWSRYPSKTEGGNRLMRDTTVARSGKASGLVWSVTPYKGGKPWMQWNKYRLRVEGGIDLIVSCHVKTEGVKPAHVGFHFYGEGRKHLGFVRVPCPESDAEWTHVRQRVHMPDNALTMGFAMYAREMGKTWYDDVAVLGTPSTHAVRGTPKVDGKLDDACWADNRAITQFAVHTGAGLSSEKTRAWIAYDDQALYVAFECPHRRGAELKAEAAKHDGNTWLDDSIEVFLDPDHDHRDYYQLAVNCLGVIRDSYGSDTQWESGARAATMRGATAWTVEAAIPYDQLGITVDVDKTWGVNLVRNDRVRGETVTWSLDGFHRASRFGNVSLAPNLAKYWQADLARVLAERERDAARLRKELGEADLPDSMTAEPLKLLREVSQQIVALRSAGKTDAAQARNGLARVAETIASARQAVVRGLFQTGGDGGFRVVIAHSLQKVRRSGPVIDGVIARRVRLEAARDETESFQLVVVPASADLKGVRVNAPPLRGPGGKVAVDWHRVGYVETAPPAYSTEYVGWWPDPLLPPGPLHVRKGERQPLWFSVSVPPDAKPGAYRGQVTVSHSGRAVSVPVELRVRGFRLPRPGTLATAFGLYAQTLSNGYHRGSYREKMAIADYARWCEFMGRYRLTPKNVAREYISLKRDGKAWQADFSALDATVADLAPKYYAPYSFCIHRVPTGSGIRNAKTKPDTSDWARLVKGMSDEWKRRRLPPEVYIYGVDEPRREQYAFLRDAYEKIRKAAPEYPIMQTIGDPNPEELVGVVDIWCPLSSRLGSPFYANRVEAGDTLWTYVCCSPRPPYANFFIDRPATEHRVLFWQTWNARATGFLYWCVCLWKGLPSPSAGKESWPDVPIHMKDHSCYKSFKDNGDGLLIYPGPDMTPYPSVRLEIIRDGIEDYEYLAMLSRLVAKAKALPASKQPAPSVLKGAADLCRVPETISRSMKEYTQQPQHIIQRRREVGDMIEHLIKRLQSL